MEKKQINESTQSLGIFIFYQEPNLEYWDALQSFLYFSLGLNQRNMFKYSVSDYREDLGYIDIIALITDDIRKIGKYSFHNIIIYVENNTLLASNYYNELYWYNMFDNYSINYVVFIYNEFVEFDEVLFPFKLKCKHNNIKIENTILDNVVTHKNMVILNKFNIDHFCLAILECARDIKLLDFIVEQYICDNVNIEMYTNFVPTNDIILFHNYRFSGLTLPIETNHIIPIYISKCSLKLLETMFHKICKNLY